MMYAYGKDRLSYICIMKILFTSIPTNGTIYTKNCNYTLCKQYRRRPTQIYICIQCDVTTT